MKGRRRVFEFQKRLAELEYKDLAEVLHHCVDRKSFDLRQFLQYNQRDVTELILPAEHGVYVASSLTPVTTFGPGAFSYLPTRRSHSADIGDFETFVSCRTLVYGRDGAQLLPCSPVRLKHALAREPAVNPNELRMMVSRVYRYMNSLHPRTRPTVNVTLSSIDEESFLFGDAIDDYRSLGERGVIGVNMLIDAIDSNFVGNDVFNLYHIELKDTVLTIMKGLDFRVVEYYRRIFDEIERQETYEIGF